MLAQFHQKKERSLTFQPGLPAAPLVVLAASVALQLAWLGLRWGTPAQAIWYADLTFLLVIYASLGLSIVSWRAAPLQRRLSAGLLCAALLALSLGESTFVYFELFTTLSPDVSAADFFYYLFYALLGLLLTPYRASWRALKIFELLLDSVIIVVVVGSYAWALFLANTMLDQSAPLLVRLVTLSYPVLDLGLLALLLLTLRSRRLSAATAWYAGGLGVYIVADLAYAFLNSRGAYAPGQWIDALWTLGTAALACGGWSARQDTSAAKRFAPAASGLQRWLSLLPYAAVVAACGLLISQTAHPTPATLGVAWSSIVLFGLVMLRQALTFRDNLSLTHQAFHDPLTGLPNRALFLNRLGQALKLAQPPGAAHPVGVLFVDLDGFKLANDRFGHAAGDQVLLQASQRMQTVLGEGDTLARIGGDEFTILLSSLTQPEEAQVVGAALIELFTRPFEVGQERIRMTASIGLSTLTDRNESADTLQSQADLALYHAKAKGKNALHVFTPELIIPLHARENLKQALHFALEHHEFELHYQPQLKGTQLIGVEALLRWNSASLGPVAPGEFIPVAEDSELIFPIGQWVLDNACRQAARWQAGGQAIRVAVNVSPRQFAHPDFVAQVAQALGRHALPGQLLEIELTERQVIHEFQSASAKIQQLQQLGVQVSLDDFGVGQSSLGQLMHLPVRALKIDRDFVLTAQDNESGRQIIQAITAVARAMQLQVVVEGVETVSQLELVSALGCEVVQGYLLGRPMSAGQLERWLSEGQPAGVLA